MAAIILNGTVRWLSWKTFCALLARDGRVARRNLGQTLLQNLLQPLLLIFAFGRILTSTGMLREAYKDVLLPGTVCVCMIMSGVWGVAMPLIMDFEFTREIDDRLMAPIAIRWLAIEKVIAGMIQALVVGMVVIPSAWLVIGSGAAISFRRPLEFVAVCLLIAAFAGAGGLALGCTVGRMHVSLIFTLVVAPLITFGCAYYPRSSLRAFPGLQYAVLLNPLVYANEGLRGALAPQVPHTRTAIAVAALAAIDFLLSAIGV
jgi:ABC-2 type transport system permease protein